MSKRTLYTDNADPSKKDKFKALLQLYFEYKKKKL